MFVLETQFDETSLVERKIPNVMDVQRLIAEIYKRPALWNVLHNDHKGRHCIPKLWQEVSQNVGIDVDQCKHKWKNLRDTYRAEVRRSERRIERDKLIGEYDPNTNYNSKWVYFARLSFLGGNKQNVSHNVEHENTKSVLYKHGKFIDDNKESDPIKPQYSSENSNNSDNNNSDQFFKLQSMDNIKMEPELDLEPEVYLPDEGDDDSDSQICSIQESNNSSQSPVDVKPNLSEKNQEAADDKLSSTAGRCTKRSYSQADFVEDLEKVEQNPRKSARLDKTNSNDMVYVGESDDEMDTEVYVVSDEDSQPHNEQNLRKSKRLDVTNSNDMIHVGDSNYNFLISLLPQMKNMTKLENLEFREKITNLIMNDIPHGTANDTVSVSSSQNVNSKNYS